MKLIFLQTKHNFSHWLLAIFSRLIISFIQIPIAIYITALGFSTSGKIIWTLIPEKGLPFISYVINSLPYYEQVKKWVFYFLNPLLEAAPNWWAMTVGLPLILAGLSIIVVNFFELYYVITDSLHNRIRCPFCKRTVAVHLDGTH